MNPAATADRIIAALGDDDPDLAHYRLANLTDEQLRKVCIELAYRAPNAFAVDTFGPILQAAASAFGVTVTDLTSDTRRHEPTAARHVACYAAHLLGLSYSHIGRRIGRDHSSVMNAVVRVGEKPHLRAVATRIAQAQGWTREVESA